MDDFHKIEHETSSLQEDYVLLNNGLSEAKKTLKKQAVETNSLLARLNGLFEELGVDKSNIQPIDTTIIDTQELNIFLQHSFLTEKEKTNADKIFDLNCTDYLITCLAGGMAVLVDFLIVRIPRDMKFTQNGEQYNQKGSPLTALFDKIGVNAENKERKWVKTLEKWFKVPYDKSLHPDIPGMNPKNHRAFSLGHDPSLSGLLWSIKDIITGTFSYIDENGILRIMKCSEADYHKLFFAPIYWLGHIISDLFTRQGIPVPGTSLLRVFQLGSIDDQRRTVGEVVTYMYQRGYNMKHFATMSICNAVIELIIRIYHKLIKPDFQPSLLVSENEYVKINLKRKMHRMLMISYSIAACGNIAKVYSYQGNPNAINLAVWLGFIKESVTQLQIQISDNSSETAIERRHVIDENFKTLCHI